MAIVGVKINDKGRTLYYDSGNFRLRIGLNIVVDTDRGHQFARVVSFLSNEVGSSLNLDKKIIRISQKNDYYQYLNNIKDADKALLKCRELIIEQHLNMNVIDCNYNLDRSQLIFRFVADERVDFRKLARDLGSIFKTRIELRQVGIRDKASEIGAIGPCGRCICCKSFLNKFDTITINMAKNQSLALNPSKINGVCGRLFCCLGYENDNYLECRKLQYNSDDEGLLDDEKSIDVNVANISNSKDNNKIEVEVSYEGKK